VAAHHSAMPAARLRQDKREKALGKLGWE
jgi:hypothetical protein